MDFTFSIKVFEDGSQIPVINFHDIKYASLNNFASVDLLTSSGVKKEIEKINLVLNNNLPSYSFADSDWCIFDVFLDKTEITNGFDEFEPFEIATIEHIDLFIKWSNFLHKYENNLIPFITYNR